MLATKLAAIVFVATFTLGNPAARDSISFRLSEISEQLNNTTASLHSSLLESRNSPSLETIIDVHWSVIYTKKSGDNGYLPEWRIDEQIGSLNKDFKDTGLSFQLRRRHYYRNESWHVLPDVAFVTPDTHEWQMKERLGERKSSVLNIYSVAERSRVRIHPSARFPPGPSVDGVVLGIDQVYVGDAVRHHHLTELVGLWAGLYHTYHGGCDPVNDGVDDTPAHTFEKWSPLQWLLCKTRESTCPGALPEPSDNFMSGSPDFCRKRFTPGQIKRMRKFLEEVRGVQFEGPAVLQHKPAYRLFSQRKEYAIVDDPDLAYSTARSLYADKGENCTVVIDNDTQYHLCASKTQLETVFSQFKSLDTCR